MPKKTKSQKIIAELRRKLATQQTVEVFPKPILQKEERIKKIPSVSAKEDLQSRKILPSFVVQDLKKSLFLTGVAIGLEFVLYYFLK